MAAFPTAKQMTTKEMTMDNNNDFIITLKHSSELGTFDAFLTAFFHFLLFGCPIAASRIY